MLYFFFLNSVDMEFYGLIRGKSRLLILMEQKLDNHMASVLEKKRTHVNYEVCKYLHRLMVNGYIVISQVVSICGGIWRGFVDLNRHYFIGIDTPYCIPTYNSSLSKKGSFSSFEKKVVLDGLV